MLISLHVGILAPRQSSEVTWPRCFLPAGLRGRVSAHSLGWEPSAYSGPRDLGEAIS